MRNCLSAEERLFRRFVRLDLKTRKPEAGSIAFPNISVNRSRLSKPEDLLIEDKYKNHGVFEFFVEDIPDPILHKESKEVYNFFAVNFSDLILGRPLASRSG